MPIAWHKVRCGRSCDFVGLHVDSSSFFVGISKSRACWLLTGLTRWSKGIAVLMREFNEALGRLGFASGPLR